MFSKITYSHEVTVNRNITIVLRLLRLMKKIRNVMRKLTLVFAH